MTADHMITKDGKYVWSGDSKTLAILNYEKSKGDADQVVYHYGGCIEKVWNNNN